MKRGFHGSSPSRTLSSSSYTLTSYSTASRTNFGWRRFVRSSVRTRSSSTVTCPLWKNGARVTSCVTYLLRMEKFLLRKTRRSQHANTSSSRGCGVVEPSSSGMRYSRPATSSQAGATSLGSSYMIFNRLWSRAGEWPTCTSTSWMSHRRRSRTSCCRTSKRSSSSPRTRRRPRSSTPSWPSALAGSRATSSTSRSSTLVSRGKSRSSAGAWPRRRCSRCAPPHLALARGGPGGGAGAVRRQGARARGV